MSELEMKNESEIETEDFTDDELSDEALDREGRARDGVAPTFGS
jgi:hypothetical protein